MNTEERRKVIRALVGVASMYGHDLPEAAMEMWLRLLDKYTAKEVTSALSSHAAESKWMPKPADIIDRLEGRDAGTVATLEQAAHAAARSIINSVGRIGVYRAVIASDPVAHEALRMCGGWMDLCNLPDSQETWWIKAFVQHYVAASRRDLLEPEPLAGMHGTKELVTIDTGTHGGNLLAAFERKRLEGGKE